MDSNILEELGLSNAEAKVYLALLKMGQSKSGDIITSTDLQSSTVYHTLSALMSKGLANYILKGKIKYFQAESPETFLVFLEEKKKRFNAILPTLKKSESFAKQKQAAKVYEGINGLKIAYNDILSSLSAGEEYYFFQITKNELIKDEMFKFFRIFQMKRAEAGIKVKALALKSTEEVTKQVFQNLKHTKLKFVNEFLPGGIIIYRNKVIILDWIETPTAIVISSNAIAGSYKKFFDEKWKQTKP
jgi:HTH-type transcriptional regulator, sugar sensing transcriptional regulator